MNFPLMCDPPSNPMKGEWSLLDGDQHATKLLFNPRGTLLAVTGKDGRVGIWDFSSLRTMVKVLDPTVPEDDQDDTEEQLEQEDVEGLKSVKIANCCAWSHNSRRLYIGYKERLSNGRIGIWNVKEGRAEFTRRFDGNVNAVDPHPKNDSLLLVCQLERNPVVLDWKKNTLRMILLPGENGMETSNMDTDTYPSSKTAKATQCASIFSHDGAKIYLVNSLGLAAIVDSESLNVLHVITIQGGITHPSIQQSPDNSLVLIPTAKGIRLLSINEENPFQEIRTFVGSGSSARMPWTSCGFNTTGDKVFGVAASRYLQVGGKGLYTWTNDVSMTEENLGGLKEGIQSVVWQPHKPTMVACSCNGNVHVLEEEFDSHWPGPMYPPNYVLISDNITYEEPEDEFDIVEQSNKVDHENLDVLVDVGDSSDFLWMQQDQIEDLLFLPALPIANQIVKDEEHFSGSIFRPTIREAAAQRVKRREKNN